MMTTMTTRRVHVMVNDRWYDRDEVTKKDLIFVCLEDIIGSWSILPNLIGLSECYYKARRCMHHVRKGFHVFLLFVVYMITRCASVSVVEHSGENRLLSATLAMEA